ncbi:hypothetical protein ElyMa_001794300 [Elysia marginata]|uniref:Uncharacterized protein n=1 Tax=Elysia marginata TaxID=1093978 RepID=A0AAV4EF46_9GAST|nr:hypothetical protein ElyMa_001794300 [Elysia marginata]
MKGHNTCQWLVIGSKELCGRSCLRGYCKVHLARLRTGPGTQPCAVCGKCVKNRFRLRIGCGYRRAQMCEWQRSDRVLKAEFKRLRAIDISIETDDMRYVYPSASTRTT